MTEQSKAYRWAKFRNGISSVAIVEMDVFPNSQRANEIIEHYSGQGYTSQGNLEEIPEKGYDSWKIAAKRGLEYAFSLVDNNWTVHINKIEGLSTDTTATIVGYTMLRAFLDKINFELSNKQIDKLEEFVLSSWTNPYKELIPDFFSLTFTKSGYDK